MSDAVPFQTTLHVRDTCLCLHAQRAARVLARRFDALLRPVGLTNAQFSLLMALNRPLPATIGPLAALLGADRTTLTAALKPLRREGLVEIAPDPDDRRSRHILLTPAGAKRLALAVPIWTEGHAALERELGALREGLVELASVPS
jgi:DNA-binding MarR family transcriptional regulator